MGFSLLGAEAALCTTIQKSLGSRQLAFCLSSGIFLLCKRGNLPVSLPPSPSGSQIWPWG